MHKDITKDYWLEDEFEESIISLMLASIEKKIVKNNGCAPGMRIGLNDIKSFTSNGAYLPGKSREITIPNQDLPLDSQIYRFDFDKGHMPLSGCYGMQDTNKKIAARLAVEGVSNFNGYSYIRLFQLVKELPKGWTRFDGGSLFKLIIFAYTDSGLDGHSVYLTVSRGGVITSCDYSTSTSSGNSMKRQSWYSLRNMEPRILKDAEQSLSFALQFEADKRDSWTITANEDGGVVTIGAEQEEIKSLLYARKLPMTSTGRKRPILHLVESHKRRLKSGIDIDISSFLRGVGEVFIGNTRFTINKPYNLHLKKGDS